MTTIAAVYCRKSTDSKDRADVKSTEVQRRLCSDFIRVKGWTEGPAFVEEDGLSGALGADQRPALKALVEAAKRKAFTAVVMVEQSRLFRENVDAQVMLRTFRRLGVDVWVTRENRLVNATTFESKVLASITGLLDEEEREKTRKRVKDAAVDRFAAGYLISSVPYGYVKVKTSNAAKAPSVLQVNEGQAAIVRRVFDMYGQGLGFKRIAVLLGNEKVPAPTAKGWAVSAVREILHRELYNGVIVYGQTIRTGPDKSKDRKRVPRDQWKRRPADELRIVTSEQWEAVRTRLAASEKNYLRRADGKIVTKPEMVKGRHLLSGFLACGVCGAPLVVRRGGKSGNVLGYACRDHGEGRGCANRSSVPYREAHQAVIDALRRTFSPEAFTAHLARLAQDVDARDRRSAERDHLLAEIPKLAAAETKLAKLVAVTDDVEALVAQLKALQAERKAAEARVGELEGIELDLRADQAQVAALQATRGEWSKLLGAHEANLPDGAYGATLARSILRKILVGPIKVWPVYSAPAADLVDLCAARPATATPFDVAAVESAWKNARAESWRFRGTSRFDSVISGGMGRGSVDVDENVLWNSPAALRCMGIDGTYNGPHPISGGSDAPWGVREGQGLDGPPKPPALESAPAKPGHSSICLAYAGPRRASQAPRARKRPGKAGALLDMLGVRGASTGPPSPPRSEAPRQSRGTPRYAWRTRGLDGPPNAWKDPA